MKYDKDGHLISPFYGYWPTQYVCYIFLGVFVISTLLHLGQAIKYRAWWLLPTAVLAGFGESVGWAGRLWSSYAPLNENGYLIQIVCTIVAATPLVGALFITFGRIVICLGDHYGRLSSRLYSRVFLSIDFICLVVQSAGGGMAATAKDHAGGILGSNIMLAGIIVQLVSLTVFVALGAEYMWRYHNGIPLRPASMQVLRESPSESSLLGGKQLPHPLKMLLVGLCIETVVLYIRAIYRTVELADGFNGKIIQTQIYFDLFDGLMVAIAMIALSVFHPGLLLKRASELREREFPMAAKQAYADNFA
ncbi:RTA1-domain-containing protein [Epithele typhae]|uniref:RTA1-domain-containing protein n=1 Tax=Epithele typhae TaxID=378194 RepID=UPI0020088ED1|nr:RTA1-domain-containing protein [Epithele typhae]KAH9923180.1 RTA1-domain-containing protein [Epithele typhae]